jgi:hypothetical protein
VSARVRTAGAHVENDMASNKVSATGIDKALVGRLNRSLDEARRRTDRFIRLFHRAKEEVVKKRWFELAIRHDEIAADCARQLREVLHQDGRPSGR